MTSKASILTLFRQILDDRKALPRQPAYHDLAKFVDYILRQFFKAAKESPFLLVEVRYTALL